MAFGSGNFKFLFATTFNYYYYYSNIDFGNKGLGVINIKEGTCYSSKEIVGSKIQIVGYFTLGNRWVISSVIGSLVVMCFVLGS